VIGSCAAHMPGRAGASALVTVGTANVTTIKIHVTHNHRILTLRIPSDLWILVS